jgi:proteic killer suppression protein
MTIDRGFSDAGGQAFFWRIKIAVNQVWETLCSFFYTRIFVYRFILDVQRTGFYYIFMIQSFKDKKTKQLYDGERVPEFEAFSRQAEKRLRVLDAADTLLSMRMLPSNRLEALGGDRKGQYSIRINNQYRIYFEWEDAGPKKVEIVDYH